MSEIISENSDVPQEIEGQGADRERIASESAFVFDDRDFQFCMGEESSERGIRSPGREIPTGSIALDSILRGGLPAGALTIVCAYTSYGKSSLCVHLACVAAGYGHPVLLGFSQMTRNDYERRWTSWATGEHYNSINRISSGHLHGNFVLWDLRELGNQFFPKLEDHLTSVGSKSDQTPLVIVDSLDGICSSDRFEFERATEKLSQVAEQTGAAVLATTQANDKAYENDTVTLECIRDARGKAFPASLLLGLGRGKENETNGTVTITADKARNWPQFQVRLGVDWVCQRFFDVDDTYRVPDPEPPQNEDWCAKMG